ncbi:hypothetical protein EFP86_05145 [Lentilactobacillus hilgardii]|nr:hypothetical protein [Lentilactobacillus hilgardii]
MLGLFPNVKIIIDRFHIIQMCSYVKFWY